MVQRQCGERPGDFRATFRHRHAVGREDFRQQLAQESAGARSVFRRLEVDVVAGGDRGGQRDQRQVDGVVPGRDHPDHAHRFRPRFRPRRQEAPAHADPVRLHPSTQVAAQVVDLVEHGHAVGDARLVQRTVAEVIGDGALHLLHASLECFAQTLQVLLALRTIRLACLPGIAQALQGGGEVGDGRFGGCVHAPSIGTAQ